MRALVAPLGHATEKPTQSNAEFDEPHSEPNAPTGNGHLVSHESHGDFFWPRARVSPVKIVLAAALFLNLPVWALSPEAEASQKALALNVVVNDASHDQNGQFAVSPKAASNLVCCYGAPCHRDRFAGRDNKVGILEDSGVFVRPVVRQGVREQEPQFYSADNARHTPMILKAAGEFKPCALPCVGEGLLADHLFDLAAQNSWHKKQVGPLQPPQRFLSDVRGASRIEDGGPNQREAEPAEDRLPHSEPRHVSLGGEVFLLSLFALALALFGGWGIFELDTARDRYRKGLGLVCALLAGGGWLLWWRLARG